MSLSLQGDDALDVLHLEPVARALVSRSELLHYRSLSECHIILVCGKNLSRVLGSSLLDHGKERTLLLLTVDDERATENLMTAMLRVDLCKTEYLRVGQRTTVLLFYLMKVFNLLRRQSQSLFLIECVEVVDMANRSRLDVNGEHILIQSIIHTLEHRVVLGISR